MASLTARPATRPATRPAPQRPGSWRDAEAGVPTDAAARCAHCDQPAPAGERFCCAGCAGAYALIHEMGLERYYQGRDSQMGAPGPDVLGPMPAGHRSETDAPMADGGAGAQDMRQFASPQADGGWTLPLMVDGLHCAACVWLIETALKRDPAVTQARVNLTARRLTLAWKGDVADGSRLARLVTRLGYRVAPYDPARAGDGVDAEGRRLLRALAVAGFAAGNIMLLSVAVWAGLGSGGDGMGPATRDLFHWLSALIALPTVAYAGQPFFRPAWAALRRGRATMDVPIAIGVLVATALSLRETIVSGRDAFFDSAVMLLFFLLIGRYLDHQARGRARSAAERLVGFMRQTVSRVEADGSLTRLPADRVAVGERVLVAAGEGIAVDGTITQGRSALDRSLIDGESLPVDVEPGDAVLAGMVNLTGPLTLTVGATGADTFLAGIARLMDAAEQGRARLVMLADRVARLYAPLVHLLALATFIAWWLAGPWEPALLKAVAVLIITCPCALGLAVPVTQVVTSGRLMRAGVLMKSGTALERLEAVDTVVFDKTGTLTLGQLDLRPDPTLTAEELALAAAMAASSRHPLSRAVRRAAPTVAAAAGVVEEPGRGLILPLAGGEVRLGSRRHCGVIPGGLIPDEPVGSGGPDAPAADAIAGKAITGDDGLPELWLTRPGHAPRRLVFTDTLRPDAAQVVADLRGRGMAVRLLSGDRPAAVAALSERLGITDWRAALSPADKCAALRDLAASGHRVMMVGDGLNDAPALAAAHVSMAPASAADIAQTAADLVFQGRSLSAVTLGLDMAKRSGIVVRQNIALAILYNVIAVPLAMAGLVTPLVAALAMSASSLLVVGNALRLAGRLPPRTSISNEPGNEPGMGQAGAGERRAGERKEGARG